MDGLIIEIFRTKMIKKSICIILLFIAGCTASKAQKVVSAHDKIVEYKIINQQFEEILSNIINLESVRNAPFLYLGFGTDTYKNTIYSSFEINIGDDWNKIQKANGFWGYLQYKDKIFVLTGSLFDGILAKTKKKKNFYYTIKPFDFRDLTTCGGSLIRCLYVKGKFVSIKDCYE
ncbi:hypothetical protein [Bacteroides sedimenti]|uniref:Lipoprotein n=1 Tax=Bacteroides sedimenti TaxID=2136147 RepID=A0ABM8IB75_9BACE